MLIKAVFKDYMFFVKIFVLQSIGTSYTYIVHFILFKFVFNKKICDKQFSHLWVFVHRINILFYLAKYNKINRLHTILL